jgi:hypothetical protein
MALRFAHSAYKHGISRERASYVIEHCGLPYDGLEEDGDALLFFGDDWNGIPLEVGAIELEDGELLVIHAMRLRQKYQNLYVRALPWRH